MSSTKEWTGAEDVEDPGTEARRLPYGLKEIPKEADDPPIIWITEADKFAAASRILTSLIISDNGPKAHHVKEAVGLTHELLERLGR